MVSWSVPTSASGSVAAERSIGASGVVVKGCLARFTEIIGKSSLSSDSESVSSKRRPVLSRFFFAIRCANRSFTSRGVGGGYAV